MKRVRWTISFHKRNGRWFASVNGRKHLEYLSQAAALSTTARHCRARWREHRDPHELIIKGRNGRIRDNRTYGLDTRGTKG
jgi:hypothetical protein